MGCQFELCLAEWFFSSWPGLILGAGSWQADWRLISPKWHHSYVWLSEVTRYKSVYKCLASNRLSWASSQSACVPQAARARKPKLHVLASAVTFVNIPVAKGSHGAMPSFKGRRNRLPSLDRKIYKVLGSFFSTICHTMQNILLVFKWGWAEQINYYLCLVLS